MFTNRQEQQPQNRVPGMWQPHRPYDCTNLPVLQQSGHNKTVATEAAVNLKRAAVDGLDCIGSFQSVCLLVLK